MTKKLNTKKYDRAITFFCVAGVLISTYALYVELIKEARPDYQAFCDIGEHSSCSRVLTSKFSKGLGFLPKDSTLYIPNCVFGTIFYCLIIFLTTFDNITIVRLQFLLGVGSVLTSFYFAYILAFILQDFCLVCVSTYIVNGFTVSLIYTKMNHLVIKNR